MILVKHDESIHESALDLLPSRDTKTQIFSSLLLELKRLCDFKIRSPSDLGDREDNKYRR